MAESIHLRVIQSIVGMVGLAGNGLVCVTIWRVPMMHTLTNAFIFNQAAVDLLASLLLLLVSNVPVPAAMPAGLAGLLLCYLWVTRFFLWSAFATSTTNLVALTLERYTAIVYPFRHQAVFGPRLAGALIGLSWGYGFLSSGFNMVWVTYTPAAAAEADEGGGGVCQPYVLPDPPVISAFLLLQMNFMLPVAVMCLAYVHIIVTLRRSARRVAPVAAPTGRPPEANTLAGSMTKATRNTFKTLFIVFVVYVVCWAPNTFIFDLVLLGVPVDLGGAWYVISLVLVVCNSCANPIIYGLKYRQFRKALRVLFKLPARRSSDAGDISTITGNVTQRD